jgi:ATP-binding protein involved in chromosome partitioning
MPVTTDQVLETLRPVEDPELHRSIVDLGMVRDIKVGPDGRVEVLVALTVAGCPLRNEITNRVTGAVQALPGVAGVGLDFTVMTDQEREDLRVRLHGDPGASAGHGHAHGHAEGRKIPFAENSSRTRPVLISSG